MTNGNTVRHEWFLMAQAREKDPSISYRAIGEMLGRTQQTVASWDRNPAYKAYERGVLKEAADRVPDMMRASHGGVKEFFQAHAEEMAHRLLDILEDTPDVKLQASIAQDMLDRAGYGAQQKDRGITVTIPAKAIEALFARATEAGLPQPTINVTPVAALSA